MNAVVSKIESILHSEYNTVKFVDLVREIFPNVHLVSLDKFNKEYTNFSSHIEGSIHIGNFQTPDNKKIIIMAVQLKKAGYVENSRSTQRSYAKKLIENGNADAAFIAFYTEGEPKWRLSLVRLDYEMKIENGRLKTAESITPAKRYSYLVGRNEPCHTAISRFQRFITDSNANPEHPTLDDLEEAFSVEKVTDEFFNLYCEKFHQLREQLESIEDFCIEAEQHNFTSAQFAKKLMGQIVFLYFLQKKGWLGVGAWPNTLNEKEYKNAFYARGAKSRELIPVVYHPVGDGIYHVSSAGLKQISDEDEAILAQCVKGKPWGSGPHDFMRRLFNFAVQKNSNFYNDVLEPLFYDALNRNRGEQGYCPALHCRIPFLSGGLFEPIDGYDWEHNDFSIPNEVFSNIDTKGREADGILDVFDRYNFTMCEDEPMEREVAIDPEMLGKVFENLLEVNDRKSKGAFYTPREIVHYMCQESLINYLASAVTDVEETDIRDFILYGDFMKDEDTTKEKRQGNGEMYISEKLYKIDSDGKVVVNKLIDIDEALKNVRVADPAVGSGAFPLGMLNEIVRARQNISAYFAITMKPYDIRMMYQLERSPHTLKYETIRNCIFAADIEPSAVDIAQLRLWLALVIDDEINPNAQTPLDGHKNPLPLPNLESNIICGNSLMDEFEGTRLIKESDLLGNTIYQMDLGSGRFDAIIRKLIEKQDELFRCDDTEKKQQLKQEIEDLRNMIILSQLEGCPADKIERFHATTRMASKPYVLWQLDFARVFREKGGFDIVIGNPPYGAKFSSTDKKALKRIYGNSNVPDYESADFFIELSSHIMRSKGTLSFIIPNTFMVNLNAKKYRLHLLNTWFIRQIDNLSDISVFESASVRNCIIFFEKVQIDHSMSRFAKLTVKNGNVLVLSEKPLSVSGLIDNIDNWLNLVEKDEIALSIVQRMVEESKLLKEISQISQGLIPYDKYRGHSEEIIKNKIWNADYQKDETYRKELRGKDVSRYMLKWNGQDWISYGEWLAAPRKPEFFTTQRILVREITNPRILATITEEEYYNTPSIINCINFTENIYSILALINSKLMSFYHNMTSPKASKGLFPKILVNDVRNLPICVKDAEIMKTLSELVQSLLSGTSELAEVDPQIDKLVYKLYGLTAHEIAYVEKWFEGK